MHQPPKNHLQGGADRFRKSLRLIAVSLLALSLPAIAQEASAGNADGPASVDELKKELAITLDRLNKMQQDQENITPPRHRTVRSWGPAKPK